MSDYSNFLVHPRLRHGCEGQPRPHRCDGGGLRAEDLRTLGMQPVLSGGRLVYRTRLNVSPIVCVGPIVAREDLTLLTKALAHIP